MGLETEFAFTLPKGYVDDSGTLHRHGTMRLATARDEIEPLRDPRISGAEDPYLTILVIARVITSLGTLRQITPNEVEGLFAADMAFLQDLYGIVNFGDPADAAQLQASVLPPEPQPAGEPVPPSSSGDQSLPVADDDDDDDEHDGRNDERDREPVEMQSRRRSRIEEVPRRAES